MSSNESWSSRNNEGSDEHTDNEYSRSDDNLSDEGSHEESELFSDDYSVSISDDSSNGDNDEESDEGTDDDSNDSDDTVKSDDEPNDERTRTERTKWLNSIKAFVKETRANTLDLRGFEMTKDEVLSVLESSVNSEITELDVHNSLLKNGMKDFSRLLVQTKLKKLNLCSCSLTDDDIIQLMKIIKNSGVTDLDISENNFLFDATFTSKFVSSLLQSHLTRLNIIQNQFMSEGGAILAQSLPNTSITHLNLCGLMDEEKCCGLITSLFSNLQQTAITDLNLSGNNLSFTEVKQLSEVIRDSKLETLDLSFNNLRDAGVNLLTRGLIHSKITELALRDNEIQGYNNLGHHLKYTRIISLDLSCNGLRHDGIFNFPDFLKGSSVASLKLDECYIGDETFKKLIKSLECTKVTLLHVSYNDIEPASISEFCKRVKFTNITDVHFGGDELSSKVLIDLANCLQESKLKHLNLHWICRCFEVVESNIMAEFIEKTKKSSIVSLNLSEVKFKFDDNVTKSLENTTITELNLENCGFTFKDISNLGAALKFTAITHLDLNSNWIRDDGMKILAECLKGSQIISLNVSYNAITTNGAKALADVLKDTNLLTLILYGNKIRDDGLYYLAEKISSTFLTVLNVATTKKFQTPFIAIDRSLWENRKTVQQLMDSFKRIVPETNDTNFQFDRNGNSSDFSYLLEECLVLYKTVVERPSAVNVLAQEKSLSLSKSQITTLMFDEFPVQFAMFVGRSVEADVAQHVNFLKKVEELGLNNITEHLLLNRPLYVVDKDQDILHPFVYKLMHKFKQPIVNSSVEPGAEEKLINYFTKHKELEGASDIIDLLRQNASSYAPGDDKVNN